MAAIEVKVPCFGGCGEEILFKVSEKFLKRNPSPPALLVSSVRIRVCPVCKQRHKMLFSKIKSTISTQVLEDIRI